MNKQIQLIDYQPVHCTALAALFYETVHQVNCQDYTKEQLDVWATGTVDLVAWNQSFLAHKTVVALIEAEVVGFGDMTEDGYLDRLYIHKHYQNQGIATRICDAIESACDVACFTTHASITAKPFFLKRGYRVVRAQEVVRDKVKLRNYVMEKKNKNVLPS